MPEERDYIIPTMRPDYWAYSVEAQSVQKVHLWVAKAGRKVRKDNCWLFEVLVPIRLPDARNWYVWVSDGVLCAKPPSRKGMSALTVVTVSVPRNFPHEATLDWLPLTS